MTDMNDCSTKFAFKEVGVSYPRFYSASSAHPTKKLAPSLADVLAFAKVPFDKVYQSGEKEIEENSPSAMVAAITQELQDAVVKGGYTVISYQGRTLFSFKKELIILNVIKYLLQHNGVLSAYAVNRKGEKIKFVAETAMPLDEFFSLKGKEILKNDESVQVVQAIGSFQDEGYA